MGAEATLALLEDERAAILAEAEAALGRAHTRHYDAAGADEVRRRLEQLFDQLLVSLRARSLQPMAEHAQAVARERFQAGFDLSEVQVAFNALEEVIWQHILAELDAKQLARALGLVGTVLGAGKDALARAYVSLAAQTRTPSLDLRALFAGTDGN